MAELKLPFSFTPGQQVPADQLQADLDTMRQLVQDLNDRVEAFEDLKVSGVFENTGKLTTNASNVVTIPGTIVNTDKFTTAAAGVTIPGTITNTNKFLTDTDGNITTPSQPAFHVLHNLFVGGQTINSGALVTVDFDDEQYDIGGDYNTTTKTFTVPKDGIYVFIVEAKLVQNAAGYTDAIIGLEINGSGSIDHAFTIGAGILGLGGITSITPAVIELDASDTVKVCATRTGGAGSFNIMAGSEWYGRLLG